MMADYTLCKHTPDEIIADLDRLGVAAGESLRDIVWDVIRSVQDSYALALRGLGRDGAELADGPDDPVPPLHMALHFGVLFEENIAEVETTVDDYLANNWGDD